MTRSSPVGATRASTPAANRSRVSEAPDRPEEHCGVFGYYPREGRLDGAQAAYFGLYSLQHRGQEAAGIAIHDPEADRIRLHVGEGLVAQVFDEESLAGLTGRASIGHVRYSTHGSSSLLNAQPFSIRCRWGQLAIAHNGNLVQADALIQRLENSGSIFQSGLDTEVLCHLISRSRAATFEEALREALNQVQGAYSLTLLLDDTLYAVRDPSGFRPLVLGSIGTDTVVASETCAFDLLGARYEREIEPGELVRIDETGVTSTRFAPAAGPTPCVFELVYFSRPDSNVFGRSAYMARVEMGRELARESRSGGDIVVPVPDSGNCAALGFSQESGIPYAMGLTRNHYTGRTFIQPQQHQRELKLKVKLNPIPEVIRDREIVLVDDSIVRGTTSRQLVKLLWRSRPRAIHLKISSPPITHPCLFGIDTPDRDQLIAARSGREAVEEYLGVTSLQYLSLEGLDRATRRARDVARGEDVPPELDEAFESEGGSRPETFCRACFDGRYPIPVEAPVGGVEAPLPSDRFHVGGS